MSFEFYYKPSGTISVTSTGTYGIKEISSAITVGSISPTPTVTEFNDEFGERWVVFFDDLEEDDYTVQLEDSEGPPQPDSFEFTVDLSSRGVTITHPANNDTVKGKNVVAWGDSNYPLTEAKLEVNEVTHDGTVLRAPSNTRPYVVQFPALALLASTTGTLTIKNSNNDEITIVLTIDP